MPDTTIPSTRSIYDEIAGPTTHPVSHEPVRFFEDISSVTLVDEVQAGSRLSICMDAGIRMCSIMTKLRDDLTNMSRPSRAAMARLRVSTSTVAHGLQVVLDWPSWHLPGKRPGRSQPGPLGDPEDPNQSNPATRAGKLTMLFRH